MTNQWQTVIKTKGEFLYYIEAPRNQEKTNILKNMGKGYE